MEPLSLHAHHERLGARFAALGGKEAVSRYRAVEDEYAAARQGVGVLDASFREHLRVTGPDRLSFIHGMVTNEVEKLPERSSSYAALLTPKGAMVGDCRVLRLPDELLLDTEPGLGQVVLDFLGRYLVSEEAELGDATADFALLSFVGPEAEELEGIVAALGFETHRLPTLLAGLTGFDLLCPRPRLPEAFEHLVGEGKAVPVGLEAWDLLRVEQGVPRYGQDMNEATIPLEAGLERAIDYDKGCYIGQEVIARATFRGQVSRKLVGLTLGERGCPSGTELRRQGKKVGAVTSVVRSPLMGQWVALGYVHKDSLEPGTALELASGSSATVRSLPFAP